MKQPILQTEHLSRVVHAVNNLQRAIVQAGGSGLIKPVLEMKVQDFLVLMVNNNIAIDATYCGE